MKGVRAFFQTKAGKVVAVVGTMIVVAVAVYMIINFSKSQTPDDAFYSTYICTETHQSFKHKNQAGESIPILSPFSGKNTGMPAEACYWTADGGIKDSPTWVLLNAAIGKEGPTFCPDCGRLVVGHNPHAKAGMRPPPTGAEYASDHGN